MKYLNLNILGSKQNEQNNEINNFEGFIRK